jgi:hypothetical protein
MDFKRQRMSLVLRAQRMYGKRVTFSEPGIILADAKIRMPVLLDI